jgi:hypothetical protein
MGKIEEQRKQELSIPKKFTPKFWEHKDQRFGVVKLIRQRVEQLKKDTAADSFQKIMLCERAIFIGLQLETMECDAEETGTFDPGVYTQMVNCFQGLLKTLGIQKQLSKTLDLKGYLGGKRA